MSRWEAHDVATRFIGGSRSGVLRVGGVHVAGETRGLGVAGVAEQLQPPQVLQAAQQGVVVVRGVADQRR